MIFPGERLDQLVEDQISKVTIKGKSVDSIRLGPGLHHYFASNNTEECILATSAGTLQYRQPNKFWLETPIRKRYVPHQNDLVIGKITVKTAEYYKVDLGGAHSAILPMATGFEAATKRGRPNLLVGSLIFCRVSQADRFIEPEVVCVDGEGGSTGGFGELPFGPKRAFMLFHCPVNVSWQLQRPDCPILALLGKHLAFEIVVGANGQYAIDAESPALILFIHRFIEAGKLDENKVKAQVKAK